jgi:hypothetical protein
MRTAVYQMFKNTDMEEGRGEEVPIPGLFLTMAVSEEAATGRGVYGSPAVIKQIPVFDNVEDFKQWELNGDAEYQQYLRLKARFEK